MATTRPTISAPDGQPRPDGAYMSGLFRLGPATGYTCLLDELPRVAVYFETVVRNCRESARRPG